MIGVLIGVTIGLSGLGFHFNPDVPLDTTNVVVTVHQCSTDCGVDD